MKTKKIAIIGASYLQAPLILKAQEMGIETHVFAWKANDVGERIADFFYPISIIERDEILRKCQEIGIDGICSIGSDLAMLTVNYIAEKMGLTSNSMEATMVSTNKHLMRERFALNGDPSPKSIKVTSVDELGTYDLSYPVIVKPLDRSGSRGITKVESFEGLREAVLNAMEQGFEKSALIEEFAEGKEYSVEYISWKGIHHFLAVTKKYTTGHPSFVETGHLEPSGLDEGMLAEIRNVIEHALTSLGLEYGASHSEIKIDDEGNIKIIEIGGRMGGDCIGSFLVQHSTGVDFVKDVIEVALGIEPTDTVPEFKKYVAIHYIFAQEDIELYNRIMQENPGIVADKDISEIEDREVTDSSTRFGYFIIESEDLGIIEQYLPSELE